MLVEETQIVRGPHPQPTQEVRRHTRARGQPIGEVAEQAWQAVLAIDENSPGPAQMIEANMIERHSAGVHAKHIGCGSLVADGDIAPPYSSVTGVQQGA